MFDPGGAGLPEAYDDVEELHHLEDLLMCMESALTVMSRESIRAGVFREGEFSVNRVVAKMFHVLFDTGALQKSYISKELVDANRAQWVGAVKPHQSVVRMADQLTRKNTSEMVTGVLSFVDDRGREVKAVIEAIVWEMPKMDFILGLPDILRHYLDMFIAMLREAELSLTESESDNVLSKVEEAGTEAIPWSNGQNAESPEELETPEPSHFAPYLLFMEVPYEEARVEFMGILDAHIGEMLKGSRSSSSC